MLKVTPDLKLGPNFASLYCHEVSEGVADSFAPGQGHEPAGEWVGGPHDGMGPECLAERAANAPPSGSNHKRIMVSLPCMPLRF